MPDGTVKVLVEGEKRVKILNYKKENVYSIILISLLFASWASIQYPSFSFYMLPTRGWELLAGALLAHLEVINQKRLIYKKINQFMPIIGIILILYSIFFFHDRILHPSFLTLIPVIGVSLIICFANQNLILFV